MLRILSVYDVLVVACSAVSYGVDNLVAWDAAGLIADSDPGDEIVGYNGRPGAFIKLKVLYVAVWSLPSFIELF